MRGYMSKKSLPTAQSGGFFIRRRIEERLPQDAQEPDRQDSRSPCARRGAGPDRTVHPATTPRRAGNVPRQNGRRPLPAHTNLRPPAYRRRICHRTTAAAAVALPSAVRTKPSPSGKERKAHRTSPPDSGEEKAPRFADILDQPPLSRLWSAWPYTDVLVCEKAAASAGFPLPAGPQIMSPAAWLFSCIVPSFPPASAFL